MGEQDQAQMERLVQSIIESPKYRSVSHELIRNIGLRELAVRRNLKEAIKTTKNKLHQVAGAYLDSKPQYDLWSTTVASAIQSDDHDQLRRVCREIMAHHASTRERLAILDSFYMTTLADLQPVRSVLDVACGFNPLAIPWMPLETDTRYYACDVYDDMIAFLNTFFRLTGVNGKATTCDLVASPPREAVDVALVLKVLPPLERLSKNSGLQVLRAINASYMLVSFPAQSLGGRDKRMVENYEEWFLSLAEMEGWQIERFVFPTELVFRVEKGESGP
jgi:16S rRNA (guanine(1405)-N(7))-methyltransferase